MKHIDNTNIFAAGAPSVEENWTELAVEMRAVEAYFKQLFGCEHVAAYMYDEDGYVEQYLEAAREAGLVVEEEWVETPTSELPGMGWKKLGDFDGSTVWVKGVHAYATTTEGGEWSVSAMYVGTPE